MEESYIEFKVFYEKNKEQLASSVNWTQLDRDYFKAKEHLQKILGYEQELEALAVHCYRERADVYTRYIKQSDKFLDENVLQTVYERMVADCCLNVDTWLTYIDFLEYRDAYERPKELQDLPVFQQDSVDVVNRALRNCPWSERLYIKRMLLLEQREYSREQIQEVLESSLSAGFQTAEPAVAIWLEYLTYLRRNTDYTNEQQCEILRKNFNLAWTILGQQWGVLADCNCEILQFWGRLEYGPLQDAKRGKELWTTVMESADNATKSGLWIEHAQLEMRRDLESTRKLYRKALNSAGLDNPPVVASAWERFERCNGSIQTLLACQRECSTFLAQYKPQVEQRSSNKATKRKSAVSIEQVAKEQDVKRVKKTSEGKGSSAATGAVVRANAQTKETHNEMAAQEHATQEIDTAKDHLRIFLSNLDYNLTEQDLRDALPELKIVSIDLIRAANGRSRGFGYLELESEAEVFKALDMDRRLLHGRPLYVSSVLRDKERRQKFKFSEGLEPKKLFVKNLPHDAKQEEMEKLFGSYGKLKDVRLVYHKSGKFKHIAYVEYEDEAAARKALRATDQLGLRGNTISVAISAPPPKVNAVATPNIPKMLGIGGKRSKTSLDMKPRMSLIPNVVRKNISATAATASTLPAGTGHKEANGTAPTGKTNADFRKLLEN